MNSIGAVSSLGNAFTNFLEPQYKGKQEAKLLLQMIKKSIHRGAGIPGLPGDTSKNMNLKTSNHHYRHYHPNNSRKSGLFVSPLAMSSTYPTRPFSTVINNYTSLTRKRQTNNTNASSSLNIIVNKKSSINGSSLLPPLHSTTGTTSRQKISKSKKSIIIGNDENPPQSTSSMAMVKKKLEKQSSYPKLSSTIFQPKENKKHSKDTKLFRGLNFHKKMSKRRSEYFPRISTTITSVKTGNRTLKESLAPTIGTMSNNTEKSSSQYPISTSHSREKEFRSLYGRLKVHYILQDETVKNLSIPEKLTRIIKNLELFEKELVDYLSHPNALPQAKVVLKDLRSRRAVMHRKLAEYSIQSIKTKAMKETPFPNIEASVPFNSVQKMNAEDNDIDIDVKKTTNNDLPSALANTDTNPGLIKEKVQEQSKLPRIKLGQSSKNDTLPPVILSKDTLSRKKGYKKYSKKTVKTATTTRQDDSFSHVDPKYFPTSLSQQEQQQQPAANHTTTTAKSTAISKPTSESKMKKTGGGGFSSFLPVKLKWRKSEFIKLLPHNADIPKNTSKVIRENPVKALTTTSTKGTGNNTTINAKSTKLPSIPNPNDANLQSWALPDLPNYKNYMSWLEEMMAMKLAEDIKNRKDEPENDRIANENDTDSNKTVTKSNNNRNVKKSLQEQPKPKWTKVPENPNVTKQKHSAFIKEFTSRLTPKFKAELEQLKPHLNHGSHDNPANLNNSSLVDSQKYISPFEIKGNSINNLSLGRHQTTFPAPAVVNPFPEMSFTFHPHHSPFVGTNPVDFQAVSSSIKSVVETTIGHQNLNKQMNPVPQLNVPNNHYFNSKNITPNSNYYEQPNPGTRSAKTASDPQSLGLHLPTFVHPKTANGFSTASRNVTATNNSMNVTTNVTTNNAANRNQVSTLFSSKDVNNDIHSQHLHHLQEESREEIPHGKSSSSSISHLPIDSNPVKYSQPRTLIPKMTTMPSQLQPPLSAPCSFQCENIEKDAENTNIPEFKNQTVKGGENNEKGTLPNSLQSFVGTSRYLQPRNYQVNTTKDNTSFRNDQKWNYNTQNPNFKMMPHFNATLAVPISHINAKLQPSMNQSTKVVEPNYRETSLRYQFLDK